MALNTRNDIFAEVLARNNRTTTDGFISDTILEGWLGDAHQWASAFHKWPFTEGRVMTTYTTGSGSDSDEWYFEGYKADSFRIITVGGKRLQKLNFADYQILREENASSSERVFADYGNALFINPNADVSGTVVAYGQFVPVIDPNYGVQTTIFSGNNEEGNEAIVEKMTSYLKRREHLMNEAELHDQRAVMKLEEVWKRILDEQYAYQTTPERGGIFKYFDVLEGTTGDELNTDQF